MLEEFTTEKAPHQLFVLLNKYYKPTIVSVPKIGKELFDYKAAYYDYEIEQAKLENHVTEEIGKIVQVRFREAWMIYLRYFLFRTAGHAQQQIQDGGNFLNADITWEDAERVHAELLKKPEIADAVKKSFGAQSVIIASASKFLSLIKQDIKP